MLQLYKIKKIKFQYLIITVIVMSFFSCKVTKHLKEGEKMLVKNNIEINFEDSENKDPGFEEYDLRQIIKPKTNTKALKLPVKLWIYYMNDIEKGEEKIKKRNLRCNKRKQKRITGVSKKIRPLEKELNKTEVNSSKYKRLEKRLLNLQNRREKKESKVCDKSTFFQRAGEPIVLYKPNNEYTNKRKIRVLLKNKGYYNSSIKVNAYPKKNNKKKVIVDYKIITGKPYTINKIEYNIEDSMINKIVLSDTTNTYIKKGSRLDTKLIEYERKRISDKLRNNGYYKFSKDYIYFSVDTIGKNRSSKIIINIKDPLTVSGDSSKHKKYIIQNVYIYPNFDPKDFLVNRENYLLKNDTIIFYNKDGQKYNIIYNNIPRINPKSIVRGLHISPDKIYNSEDINASYKYLASLQIIQIANINFIDAPASILENDSLRYIDCEIRLTQDMLQSNTLSAEITHTSGNLGIAGNINYEHLNIFRNTEILNLKLNGVLKRITNIRSSEINTDSTGFFNSFEYGFDLGLKFPRLLAPLPLKKFIKRSNPKTLINGKYNFVKEPDHSTSVAGLSFGYNWYSTKTINHAFTPITGDIVRLINPTESFIDWIDSINIKESYDDHFIFGSSYRFTFNNQLYTKKKNFIYFTTYSKLVGNSLSAVMKLTDQEKVNDSYVIADNTFAQFIKYEFDIRYYRKLNREKDKLVFRLFAGVVYPYGNLKSVPFTEQYFSGGANGIRAWQERSLGPGSYDLQDNYVRSDLKLETNFEYRMKLFWHLEGALFVDAGNIWAVNDQDTREGALFEFNDFYKEIAVGTGFGFRFDFNFLVIRFDMGRKLFNPVKPINDRFVRVSDRGFKPNGNVKHLGNWTFNIGIGYPF